MKRYEVIFSPGARDDAFEAAEYIARHSPRNAAKWYAGLEKAITSLQTLPGRCGLAPEAESVGGEIRHYLHKSHRIIFRVEEEAGVVRILHVRHAARRAIGETPSDDSEA